MTKSLSVVVAMALSLGLLGCGSAAESARRPSSTPRVVEIGIENGTLTPRGKRVEVAVGQAVTLRVSSDVDDHLHVHSTPEHEYHVPAGSSAKDFTFAIDTPGQVAVESHRSGVTIVQLVVRP